MSYKIIYAEEPECRKRNRSCLLPVTLLFLCLFLFLTNGFWPEGREVLQRVFLPGDPQTVKQAAQTFVQGLQLGEPFSEALEAFCQNILLYDPIA